MVAQYGHGPIGTVVRQHLGSDIVFGYSNIYIYISSYNQIIIYKNVTIMELLNNYSRSVNRSNCSCRVQLALKVRNTLAVKPSIKLCKC